MGPVLLFAAVKNRAPRGGLQGFEPLELGAAHLPRPIDSHQSQACAPQSAGFSTITPEFASLHHGSARPRGTAEAIHPDVSRMVYNPCLLAIRLLDLITGSTQCAHY